MASSKVKLEVDASGWDGGLKKAVSSVQQMERECRKVNGTFEVVEQKQLAVVKALGQMETKAGTSKGQLRELTNSINDLTSQYKRLTSEEQKSPFGKAMSASINQLKGRAAELKDQMDDLNEELKHMASDTSFTDGVNMMTQTVGSCASAIVAWSGDSKEMEEVIKDLAKIQTTISAVQALTKAFQAQNLVLMKNPYVLITAAIAALGLAAYKAAGQLNEMEKRQKFVNDLTTEGAKNAQDEIVKVELLTKKLKDNSESIEERRNALTELKALVPEYHGALSDEGNLINDNANALTDYISKLKQAATAEAAYAKYVEIRKGLIDDELEKKDAERALKAAQDAQALEDANRRANGTPRPQTSGGAVAAGSYHASIGQSGEVASKQRALDGINKSIAEKQRQLNDLEGLMDVDGITGGGKKGGGGNKDPKYDVTGLKVNEKTGLNYGHQWNYMGAENVAARQNALANKQLDESLSLGPGTIGHIQEQWNKLLEGMQLEPIPVSVDVDNSIASAKKMEQSWGVAASAISKVGGAMSSLNEPALNIATMLAETIATLGLTYAQTLAKDKTSTSNIWAFIAAAAASTISLAATVASYKKSMNSYADGGVIKGGAYTGDAVPIMANAGEIVLNASMASNLASNLQSNIGGGGGRSYISGEQIVTVVNSYGRRTGRGEILR